MRSNAMAKIKSTGTKPETKLKKCLWDMGIRYRKCSFNLPGNPDLSFVKYKLVVFVDGSFWHGHDWGSKRYQIRSNREFWISKIERNRQRDQEINHFYLRNGWRVLRFWDFEIKKELGTCVKKILDVLTQHPKSPY
ncbi:very short patch repair endonuclease [Pleomorphovibrio marinus]|uniref:very short patch repair endonuclease n=1 Tax=Pleomorphovibrio marinus TaxID=2164132 RepID=UPI000E0C79F7|nr:very short patch repair endonuclease [Pleomorphovibrio marinus]